MMLGLDFIVILKKALLGCLLNWNVSSFVCCWLRIDFPIFSQLLNWMEQTTMQFPEWPDNEKKPDLTCH